MSEESNLTEKLQEKQSEIKFTEEELTQVQNIQKSAAYMSWKTSDYNQIGDGTIQDLMKGYQEYQKSYEDNINDQGGLIPGKHDYKPLPKPDKPGSDDTKHDDDDKSDGVTLNKVEWVNGLPIVGICYLK